MITSPALEWANDQLPGLTAAQKLVLLYLAMNADGQAPWTVEVAHQEIAAWAALSNRRVYDVIWDLEKRGIVKIEKLPEGQRRNGWYSHTFGL